MKQKQHALYNKRCEEQSKLPKEQRKKLENSSMFKSIGKDSKLKFKFD